MSVLDDDGVGSVTGFVKDGTALSQINLGSGIEVECVALVITLLHYARFQIQSMERCGN